MNKDILILGSDELIQQYVFPILNKGVKLGTQMWHPKTSEKIPIKTEEEKLDFYTKQIGMKMPEKVLFFYQNNSSIISIISELAEKKNMLNIGKCEVNRTRSDLEYNLNEYLLRKTNKTGIILLENKIYETHTPQILDYIKFLNEKTSRLKIQVYAKHNEKEQINKII